MKDLIVVGAGGFGRELVQIIKDINKDSPTWNILGFIDDNPNALDGYQCDYKIIGNIKDYIPNEKQILVCAIANPQIKKTVITFLKERGANFTNIIHPTAMIGDHNIIGEGCVIYPSAKITVNTILGDFVTLLGSNVGHDVIIGNYCTITGLCSINGGAKLDECVFVGGGSIIAPRKKVGKNAYVGTGSIVVTNIRKDTKVMGNPAKKIDL